MKKILVLLSCITLLFGCSSGGSDSSGGTTTGTTAGVTYTGATTPATITAANADALAGSAVKGSSGGQVLAAGAIGSGGLKALSLADTVLSVRGNAGSSGASVATGAIQAVNQITNGADTGGSGTATLTGQADDVTGYGTFTFTFNQFNDGTGTTINGSMTLASAASGETITFDDVTIQDATGTFRMSGEIKLVSTTDASGLLTSDTVTMNFVASDSAAGNQIKLQNFAITSTYDVSGSVTSDSISGRVYDSANGYLDITTTSPLVYSPAGALNPSSGGPVVATGANNTKERITPIDATNVLVEADTTGDGNYDYSVQKAWSAL